MIIASKKSIKGSIASKKSLKGSITTKEKISGFVNVGGMIQQESCRSFFQAVSEQAAC